MFVWFSFMKCDFLLIEYSLVVLNPLNLPFYPIDVEVLDCCESSLLNILGDLNR